MSSEKKHYSYAEYAKPEIAEGFEELRFGGPIGQYMRDQQDDQLRRWIAEPKGRKILDIGAGTGRTAIPLAQAGAEVVAADASEQMLGVARKNAEKQNALLSFKVCDVLELPFADKQFDTIMCFRVLLHVTDWKKGLSEICRCSGEYVILDYPPRWSLAALQVPWRSFKALFDKTVQNYRLFSLRQMKKELRKEGFEIVTVEKLWVFPIAFHKLIGSLSFTRILEKIFACLGLKFLFGAPVTLLARRINKQDN